MRDKRAHKAVTRKQVDTAVWSSVHSTCFMPLCGALRNFGTHKERPVGKFRTQVVKMMEKLAEIGTAKEEANLPLTNILEMAMGMNREWVAEVERLAYEKAREVQLQEDMAQVNEDLGIRPPAPVAVVAQPPAAAAVVTVPETSATSTSTSSSSSTPASSSASVSASTEPTAAATAAYHRRPPANAPPTNYHAAVTPAHASVRQHLTTPLRPTANIATPRTFSTTNSSLTFNPVDDNQPNHRRVPIRQRQGVQMRFLDMVDDVDEGNLLANQSMNRLDAAMERMSNPGVQTTQMLANLSTFISNVGDGNLRDNVTPVIQTMIAKLGREMNGAEE